MINLFVGLFMIGIGFSVKAFPKLIAGYNTMPEDKKVNVDIEGLSGFMRNVLIAVGMVIISGYFLFKWLGYMTIANSMLIVTTLTGLTIILTGARRFDHNNDKKVKGNLTFLLPVLVMCIVIALLSYGYMPSKCDIQDDTIRFKGIYGFEIRSPEIESVELNDKIPEIKLKANGFNFGKVKKGSFKLDNFGNSRLLIHSDNPPFIIISTKSGNKFIVNYSDETETQKVFNSIKLLTGRIEE